MKVFQYKIKDELGIHARPAGLLTKQAKEFESEIIIEHGTAQADATRLMAVMAMGIKCGDTITLKISGKDEDAASAGMEKFLSENL